MEAAGEKTTSEQRQQGKNRVVIRVGGSGGGLLLLGGALVATAALGVAFVVRRAKKKKTKEAQQEKTCGSEGRAEALPPPTPLPQGEKDSGSKDEQMRVDENPSGGDDSSATMNGDGFVKKSDYVHGQGKITEKRSSSEQNPSVLPESGADNSPVGGGQGQGGEDSLPVIINKTVVLDESKTIQVVEGDSNREEDGTEKSLGAKAMQPTLPSLGLLHKAAREEAFHATVEKKLGVEQNGVPWRENTGYVLSRIVLEMKKKGFSMNAQVLLVMSTVLLTIVLAIWLQHYSNKVLESNLM